MRLLLATRNAHKLREFERLLPAVALEPLPADVDTPPEDGETYAANALIKARAAVAATGRAAIADDSGIEAEALGGAPGVRTARFAGEHATDAENLATLRRRGARRQPAALRLRDRPRGRRRRRAYLRGHDGRHRRRRAARRGRLRLRPAVRPRRRPRDGRTMAELTDAEKDAISHRGRAARALAEWLGR